MKRRKTTGPQPAVEVRTLSNRAGDSLLVDSAGRCLLDRLPTELLAHIFLMGTSKTCITHPGVHRHALGYMCDGEYDEEGPPFEVLVSQVCHRWREVAIGSPSLWTQLGVLTFPPYTKAKVYLDRSKQAPVDIVINLCDRHYESCQYCCAPDIADSLSEVWTLVAPHVSHWRSFEFHSPDSVVMHTAMLNLRHTPRAAMLETLTLTNEYRAHNADTTLRPHHKQKMVLFGGDAPKLKRVTLTGVNLDWSRSPFLAGLHDFALYGQEADVRPSFQDIARIMQDSPDLQTISFGNSGPAGDPSEWATVAPGQRTEDYSLIQTPVLTTLSSLSVTRLYLTFHDSAYAAELVSRMVLPNLTSLHLDVAEGDCTSLLDAFARPVLPGGKPLLAGLRTFGVGRLPGQYDSALVNLCSVMTELTSLEIMTMPVSYKWFFALVYHTVLPRLTLLSLVGLSGPAMCELVKIRQEQGAPLWHLALSGPGKLKRADQRWLQFNTNTFKYFELSEYFSITDLDLASESDVALDDDGAWDISSDED